MVCIMERIRKNESSLTMRWISVSINGLAEHTSCLLFLNTVDVKSV